MTPHEMIVPNRKIRGFSAILLPFTSTGAVDWPGFEAHVERTAAAGLAPAVNMDTGYGNLIDTTLKTEVLSRTREIVSGGDYVAGAFVGDRPEEAFREEEYAREMQLIDSFGGIPVLFQSYGLTAGSDAEIAERYRRLGQYTDRYIGFELGTMFAPFGKIYSLDLYRSLLGIPQCIGAKHSSLSRRLEWDRLLLRNEVRPDFLVLTGNDLAIDMVIYGSDYLLGLSTFAPDLFALRDKFWLEGNDEFYELNDTLQYLGHFAFRVPVPAYKHNAAQFLHLRNWIETDETHPDSARRPESDRFVLQEILDRMERWL
ncbi:dihydrodipicolinate synthase family protein [Rubinisphaera margarita]|uniref:dihydrodipicolinate synthase family protein n=1 Tax=Rubinisphaera margarita TaxID=2909586 RepID=UPI001EE93E7C|nr:dihydrodipicolinate synthase family protein [Rubinisphaera margarita]MCG6154536.1 dihydrodipicolinate synthase family protein [Rubinisphaera margarita]